MSGITLLQSTYLVVSLLAIALGLRTRNRSSKLLLPVGVVGVGIGALYFLSGTVPFGVRITLAAIALTTGFIWQFRLVRELRMQRPRALDAKGG